MPTEFERARNDVLAYFLNDHRDTDHGADAIEGLPIRQVVAIIDAVIRGLVTDPSVAYALAWADAGGTPPAPLPPTDEERQAARDVILDAGLFTGPLMVSVSITDLDEALALGRHTRAIRDPNLDDSQAFDRVDAALLAAKTPRSEWASGIAYTGELAVTAITEAAEAIRETVDLGADAGKVVRIIGDLYAAAQGIRYTTELGPRTEYVVGEAPMPDTVTLHHDDVLMAGRWIEGRLLAESGRLGPGYDIGAVTGTRLSGILLGAVGRALTTDDDLDAGETSGPEPMLDEVREMAEHTPPAIRASAREGFGDVEGPLDPYEVVVEAARWIRARLGSASGVPVGDGSYDALSGIHAANALDRFAVMMSEGRPALVDDVHRLAEAGGKLAKAVDLLLGSRVLVVTAPAAGDGTYTVREPYLRRSIEEARESWGHAARGVYAVPAPRFVDAARKVAVAAGELGAYVTGGPMDSAGAIEHAERLGVALDAFDEVDTAYQAARDAHARRVRLSE